jgi:hypothetical protein
VVLITDRFTAQRLILILDFGFWILDLPAAPNPKSKIGR